MTTYTVQLNVTDQEKAIVRLLADGNTVQETAEKLYKNRRTLEAKITALKQKYRSATLPNLVAVFLRNKLIE